MFDDNDLFQKAETHWAAKAARGRIEAINNNEALHWVVQVRHGAETKELTFDRAPSFGQIVRRVHALGFMGEVNVSSIKVGRKRPRPLLVLPWQRRTARQRQAVAAE
jgi:hypothetical protein